MAEHVYQFGDPVWVEWDDREWEGYYIRLDGTGRHLVCHADNENGDWNCVGSDEVRPRLVAPTPTGWRLPEPGDVVRVESEGTLEHHLHGAELAICDSTTIVTAKVADGVVKIIPPHYKLVRLHDAPSPPPAPVEPKPETSEPLSAATVNGLYDYTGHDWIKVKAFKSTPQRTLAENYQGLHEHHIEETTFLIAEVRKLAGVLNQKIKAERMNERAETPEPWVSFDKFSAQKLIGCLTTAAVVVERITESDAPVVRERAVDLVAALIEEVNTALGADR